MCNVCSAADTAAGAGDMKSKEHNERQKTFKEIYIIIYI